ncbi:hypothetical protein [Pseudomonas syringae]|uniref:hypothetical protein n=1 Tax=Pseudomonas syringae TaxID=317 RepID=UPI001F2D31BC|nr:hypothetical protein [Pseudomonas syringae]MCF9002958.1 hypothetical protein [Pseudomonas syringae]MDF7793447.1 hypothetical protein [Pseudomonas syringae]
MEVTWWEKTVEYRFVFEAVNAGKLDFAAPLSGIIERTVGDGIFGKASSFILIEFKRDVGQLSSEKTIFTDYENAKESLKQNKHHVIIYGTPHDVPPSSPVLREMRLAACHYFDTHISISPLETLNNGVSLDDFMSYLQKLMKFKKKDKRSGTHAGSGQLSMVLGVSTEGKIVQTQSLYQFAPSLFPALTNKIGNTLGG